MTHNLPRMTIITPSFNQGAYIEQTIRSILDQGYPDLEYWVLDGGSTDETLDILRKYESRLQWISEKDRGQSHAINKGLRKATGEIIAFLNSDDYYEPGALLKVGQFFAGTPKAAWVTGKCRTVDPQGQEMRRSITLYKNLWLRTRSYKALLVLNYISQPATFWRKEVVDRIGEFDEALRYTMDYDYWLRVGQHYRLWFINEYLTAFRLHPSSKSGSSTEAQFAEDLETARRYVPHPVFARLHTLHNALIMAVYRRMLARSLAPGA